MSKCREAFEQHCKEQGINPDSPSSRHMYFHCKVMWNAAMKNAVLVCEDFPNDDTLLLAEVLKQEIEP